MRDDPRQARHAPRPPRRGAGRHGRHHAAGSRSFPASASGPAIVNYRKIQLDKLKNVEFIPNTKLSAKDVAEYGAEIVIVATGSYWSTDGLNGASHATIDGADASLAWQATPDQIMGEGKELRG